ncbi:hypothetical protein NL676_035907 [Syzygium grande]|nr:hypothetical protein NL676_035907 [Syzygium grande]
MGLVGRALFGPHFPSRVRLRTKNPSSHPHRPIHLNPPSPPHVYKPALGPPQRLPQSVRARVCRAAAAAAASAVFPQLRSRPRPRRLRPASP